MNTKNGHKQEKPTPINSSLISEEIIGREKECETLIDMLFEKLEGPPTIISIVGLGGIGKTTLAQKAINDSRVKDHFEPIIWLSVSDKFDKVELTKQMLKEVCKDFSTTDASFDTLQKKLKKELASKKVLLMLDDVWYVKDVNKKTSYEQDLSSLLIPLNFAKAGSKVIVTNREDLVLSCWGPSRLVRSIPLDDLNENDCRSLFNFWAFDASNQNNRQYLEPIGREIVAKLKGNALATRVIGGELRGISDIEEWKQILNDNSLDKGNIMSILCRSYDHLPVYLQRCFAYCSLFPKGNFLKPDRVVQMWIAQGFVHPRRGESSEKIGKGYFKELIARSFIKEVKYGNKTYYVMSNFLNDLARHVSKGECHIFKEGDTIEKMGSVRHLCVSPGAIDIIKDIPGLDKLRTLIFQSSTSFNDKIIIDEIFNKLKRVRVLDIEWCLKNLPNVAKYKHLRYLCFRNYAYNLAPNYFSKLHQLAALFIRKGAFYYDEYDYDRLILPRSMRTMSSLRFIDVSKSILVDAVQVPLQKLLIGSGFFLVNKKGKKLDLLRDINNNIKYLEISGLENICSKDAIEAQINGKKHVTGLRLSWSNSRSKVKRNKHHEVLEALQPNRNIEKLMIDGYLGDVCPSWLESNLLSAIKSIKLKRCNGLKWLPALGQLQELKKLCIESMEAVCRISDEFYGNGTFPTLEVLIIKNMRSLEEWSFPRGVKTFPKLNKLNIHGCPKLIAPEWDRFPALQWLEIWGCDAVIIKAQLKGYGYIPSLTIMEINNCKKINSLEGLRELFSLKDLTISNCPNLVSFSERELFYSLESLEIGDCPKLRSLPKKGLPVSLGRLTIRGADHDLEKQIISKSGKEWDKVDAISRCYCDISGEIVEKGWS